MKQLSLHEELLMLALGDDTGTIEFGTSVDEALGGAIVAELVLRGNLRVVPKKKVAVADSTATNEPFLDASLAKLAKDTKPRSLSSCVERCSDSELRHRIAGALAKRGILETRRDMVLAIFPRRIYPTRDPEPEREVVARLERAIFADGDVDARTAALIALADAAGLLRLHFGKRLRLRKDRIKNIISGDAVGDATRELLEALEAASMVAVMIPVLIN